MCVPARYPGYGVHASCLVGDPRQVLIYLDRCPPRVVLYLNLGPDRASVPHVTVYFVPAKITVLIEAATKGVGRETRTSIA
eukprot:2337428-Rhodomonas_salina.2